MSSLPLKLKHAGKSYDVTVDLAASGLVFKHQIHELTGVDPAKVKVPVKGGMLKVRSHCKLWCRRSLGREADCSRDLGLVG